MTVDAQHAFAFQTGTWRVRHRKLKERLAGCTEWVDFDGTCRGWELLDGAANADDHWLDDPNGAYRAATVRRMNPDTGRWSIWWIDQRLAEIGPPVHGGFDGGVGLFHGKDMLRGQAIDVRFIWSEIDKASARWEQAFSADEGAGWETNWVMEFKREG
ncbi:MAG TPA: DUF1579 domain-containing protein [Sphingomonas sp.]|nr:DUF1579 domain-containing protein [Sphingomonas sp.]